MLIMMLTMIIVKLSRRGLPFLQRKHDGRHMQSYAMMPANAQLASKPGRMEDPTLCRMEEPTSALAQSPSSLVFPIGI